MDDLLPKSLMPIFGGGVHPCLTAFLVLTRRNTGRDKFLIAFNCVDLFGKTIKSKRFYLWIIFRETQNISIF